MFTLVTRNFGQTDNTLFDADQILCFLHFLCNIFSLYRKLYLHEHVNQRIKDYYGESVLHAEDIAVTNEC